MLPDKDCFYFKLKLSLNNLSVLDFRLLRELILSKYCRFGLIYIYEKLFLVMNNQYPVTPPINWHLLDKFNHLAYLSIIKTKCTGNCKKVVNSKRGLKFLYINFPHFYWKEIKELPWIKHSLYFLHGLNTLKISRE